MAALLEDGLVLVVVVRVVQMEMVARVENMVRAIHGRAAPAVEVEVADLLAEREE
jgi:hypothetical protein